MSAVADLNERAPAHVHRVATLIFDNLSRVVRGKPEQIRLAICGLLAGGHVLIDDIPGVGKTLLAKALARSIGGTFRRVQATPDLLPADITGVTVFHRGTEEWHFRPGPVFANVLLVDEINRATPRTQAALLEAMEERQVTVDGQTWALPEPFVLIATQNPYEQAGTFPLPEGQVDRFAVVVRMGYPDRSAEREVLLGRGGADLLPGTGAVAEPAAVAHAIAGTRRVHVDPALAEYVVEVVAATRARPDILLGASPRAGISLLRLAQAYAVVTGRHFVTPDDVKAVAPAALAHRVLLPGGPDLNAASAVMGAVLGTVPAPRAK